MSASPPTSSLQPSPISTDKDSRTDPLGLVNFRAFDTKLRITCEILYGSARSRTAASGDKEALDSSCKSMPASLAYTVAVIYTVIQAYTQSFIAAHRQKKADATVPAAGRDAELSR